MPRQEADDLDSLLEQPALAATMSSSLRALAARGELRRYRKGTVLIEEGDQGDTLYVILKGQLRAYSVSASGREITYGVYGAGEYLGEMSLDGGPRSASVEAIEPTLCAAITRRTLQQHLADHPDFAFELVGKVIRRARAATLSAKQLALNDVYGRLKLLLESMAVVQDDGAKLIADRLTHHEMAARLGCSREMVSRLMKDLVAGDYLSVDSAGVHLSRNLPPRW